MKTAGVIGGHDFLGCDITLKLLSENYRVKILVPEPSKDEQPLISTGLKASDNLLYCRINMHNQLQLELFIEDCDCLIHCGMPYKLLNVGEGTLYIPVITNTGSLLRSIKNANHLGKIILLTSGSVFNRFNSGFASGVVHKEKEMPDSSNNLSEKAFYHSGRLADKLLDDFSDNQIEIVVVSPAVVLNNSLVNSREFTLEGLRYMFRHKVEPDMIFQRLLRRKLLKTMVNVIDLPDRVLDSIESYLGNAQVQKLPGNVQF